MISPKLLLAALQKRVTLLEDDLRDRCDSLPAVDAPLKTDYEAARAKGRTGMTYNAWRDEELTQVSVAWVLAGVFVRFLEDNELIDPPLLAGGNASRHQRAQDEHSLFFHEHPTASEREYFEQVFTTVGKLPGLRDFFDRRHNPLWRVGPTADAAKALLEFWGKHDPDTGRIIHDFTDPEWDTRFLGDLYQDLSEAARKKFALLQTPVFVEEFILDRTLTPAIQAFGYKAVRMIDPTCGSGHFLLGGFERLFRLAQSNEPGENPTVLARRALDQVYGVDLNPNVVAIARFRLLVAALRACGVTRIKNAPDFRLNLASGDSLLHGSRFPTTDSHEGVQQTFGGDDLFRDELKHFYESEDREELHRILGQQYHAVVGNPPYISVKDRALNSAYRSRFDSCHGKYSLAVPFMERFFDIAFEGDNQDHEPAGYVGMITADSFMKREFGKKLIEEFIPKWDLTHVIATNGAYIPGHGTPTVIIFGKHQLPVSDTIRTVMGIKGEPSTPIDPTYGLVWTTILKQVDHPGSQSEFVSVSDIERASFHRHPWSIGGGGASELKEMLDESGTITLEKIASQIGITGATGEDDLFLLPNSEVAARLSIELTLPAVLGDEVREWCQNSKLVALWPYDIDFKVVPLHRIPRMGRLMWPARSTISRRKPFGIPIFQRGMSWYEWQELYISKLLTPLTITFAEVATHNHFFLERSGKVFNRTAPVIKLQIGATDTDHLSIIGILNSSIGCFWLKQVCFPKGGDHQGGEGARVRTTLWDERYAFNSTQVGGFPVPAEKPIALAQELDRLALDLKSHLPEAILAFSTDHTRAALDAAKQCWTETLQRMIALQEELDWECYRLYGLGPKSEVRSQKSEFEGDWENGRVPPLKLGERAFEIVMARKMAAGELQTTWFERHGSTPITELPAHWRPLYRELVERRIALIESDRNIALIEQPEYKRRWNVEPWDKQLERALREWLLNRLECYFFGGERMENDKVTGDDKVNEVTLSPALSAKALATTNHPLTPSPPHPITLSHHRSSWPAGRQPALVTTSQLATVVETDPDFLRLAEIYRGGPGFSISQLVRELVEDESVPFLPCQRYKDTGLRKRQDWEHVWDLQREEDDKAAEDDKVIRCVGDKVNEGTLSPVRPVTLSPPHPVTPSQIPVPPKYVSGDFKKSHWWKLRGKLDVPKERWIIYPGAERDGDPSPVIAWAGWDHQQQAQALAEYYLDASQNRGWDAAKLKPLLAGLADLLPWLKQWHNALDPATNERFGDYLAAFLDDEARKQGTTIKSLNEMRFVVELQETIQAAASAHTKFQKGLDSMGRAKTKSNETPKFASFDEAYPSNKVDKFVCALALDIMTWRDSVESSDHIDTLILATHPDLCKILMTKGNTSQLDSWVASLKSEIRAIQTKGLKWVQCVAYLEEHRHALAIGRAEPGRPIRAGVNFDSTRKSFPFQQNAMTAFALGLLDSIKKLRQSGGLSTEQTVAFATIKELHAQYALV